MYRKVITACLAVAALAAFALPATASAKNTPTLTDPAGHVAVGALIQGTNVGETFLRATDGSVIQQCTTAVMTGSVHKNTGGNVEGNITSAVFGGTGGKVASEPAAECTGIVDSSITTSAGWCLQSTTGFATHEFRVRGGICSVAAKPITFTMVTTGIGTCHYERAAGSAITGKYTTGAGGTLSVTASSAGSGFTRVSPSGFFCPASGYLEMTFAMETDNAAKESISVVHAP
jgi:hypothetical protein